MTVRQLFELYSHYQDEHMARATASSRISLIKRWVLPVIGDKELSRVVPSDINVVYDDMESAGLKANTLFGAYAATRSLFNYAQQAGFVDDNPAAHARQYNAELKDGDKA